MKMEESPVGLKNLCGICKQQSFMDWDAATFCDLWVSTAHITLLGIWPSRSDIDRCVTF